MFKKTLEYIINGGTLTEKEAMKTMEMVMNGTASPVQIASFLSMVRFRGETVDELTGFIRSMRSHALKIEHEEDVMDTCGTGGDCASTFNISTASAILLSSMGVKVAKHGNRAVSSKSGSVDVLELLDIPVQSAPEEAVQSLKDHDLCFLFAQSYHRSMKHAAEPRRELGFRTTFNLLGPLVNPASCKKQLIGVYDCHLAEKLAQALVRLGAKRMLLVTGEDGLDEVTIAGKTKMILVEGEKIEHFSISPEDVGLKSHPLSAIQVANAKDSADLIEAVFKGCAPQAAIDTVLLNTAAGLYVYGKTSSITEGVEKASQALYSGAGYNQLQKLRSLKKVETHA
ncbi:anthranilate phosphoribosyltransferase [Scopulibacillus cellulosilyticus]|uniref:Anthranilate phosphoribosyltransferase n=1 Tax=Scopulibacillus cellulosilyticus TaxID=2665665 RepID=A0ABW2PQ90_9BACL